MLPMVNPESEARMDIISATPLRRDDIMAKSVENAMTIRVLSLTGYA